MLKSEFKAELVASIGDINKTYWPDSELNLILEEALLTFGAISGFWKTKLTYEITLNKILYDAIEDATNNKNRIKFSYTYKDLINWFNKDFLETISDTNQSSEIITIDELFKFTETRIDSYNQQTSLILQTEEFTVDPDQNFVLLNNRVLDIVRIEFLYKNESNDNVSILLLRDDEEQLSYSDSSLLEEQGLPEFFTELFSSGKDIRIYPKPNVPGTLRVIYVKGVNRLEDATLDKIIEIPNNLIPYIKYGIYEDIFSKDGLTNDMARAAYCNTRWKEGIQVGKFYTSFLRTVLNDVPIFLDSLNKLDQCIEREYQEPSVIGLAGYNIFGTDSLPDDTYSLVADSIANAIIPEKDEDPLEIRIEFLEFLLDYCVHLAIFKLGYEDLAKSIELKNNFIKSAMDYNIRLTQNGFTYESLLGRSKRQEQEQPRIVEASTRAS